MGERLDPKLAREMRFEIEEFHTEYCSILDRGALDEWLVYAEGRSMIRDRAFTILNTQMFAPRYIQIFTSNVKVFDIIELGFEKKYELLIKSKTNYLLLQTLVDAPTTIHQSGRYYDTFVRKDGRLLIQERQCIYDSVLIANDLVYPV